jgi:KaiC/GvpD/RAD55 family RecA-like ATPase
VEVEELERSGAFSIIDSYTVQLGMATPEAPSGRVHFQTQSVKLSDWSIPTGRELKTGPPEPEKRRLHIDDATSVLLQYNDEKLFIDSWRTRFVPLSRVRELAFLNSLVTGVYSESLYRMFESLCDGIIEIKSEEKGDAIEHFVRVRALRGKSYEARRRQLRLLENGEVALAD